MCEENSKSLKSAFTLVVEEDDYGKRFDFFVAEKIEAASRKAIVELITTGQIQLDARQKKPAYKIKPGEVITGSIPPPPPVEFNPEKIDLDIIYEDEDLIVVNKQSGLVVHPAPGNWSGTLVNGLLFHFPEIEGGDSELRPGIVHRLDKDTSGAIVVAKNRFVHSRLSDAFKSRDVYKEYSAIVYGDIKGDKGIIDLPIGRHTADRKKMSVNSKHSRHAETHWFVEERFICATKIKLVIKTGRTHQIRVHCQSMGHPVVGDLIYSGKKNNYIKKYGKKAEAVFKKVNRQMLHSRILKLSHPRTKEELSFDAPVSEDIKNLINELNNTK